MDVTLLAGAERDVFEIFARIESHHPESADAFLRRFESVMRQLGEHPESAPIYAGRFSRLVMRGYPFGVFYSVENTRLFVQAVLDLRQDPEAIRRRLELET